MQQHQIQQQRMQQQHPQLQLQQPPKLQTALSQPSQASQSLQTQVMTHPQQQSSMQTHQTRPPQKSPRPVVSQSLQFLGGGQWQQQQQQMEILRSIPMQQQGLQGQQLQQLGMQQQQHGIGQIQHPNFQLQNQQRILQQQLQQQLQNQQQQQQQLQNQQQQLQNQQQQQQLQYHQQLHGQPQQFVIPPPSKTPPQQLHSPSQHNQQMMNQQQMLAQGTMRPPQSPQQGQPQQGQQVHFQILQPQNRLQVVMGIPPKQQYQQGQQPPSVTPMQPNPQNVFRQQQPHVQSSVAQTLKPPFLHSVQQQRPPSMMLSPQPQAQPQQSHPPIQVMQGGQQGSTIQLQSILSPQQQQNKQFLEIGAAAGQQGPGTQHYNVVIHQGQPFTPMNPPPPRQIGQPRHPSQPGLQTQPGQVGQKSSFQPVGQRPGVNQWSQQQQLEIFRQIQMDPNIKAKWNQMDHQQRTLLIGKLVQRHREDQLRNQLMKRHQNQQAAMQNQAQAQSQGQPITTQVASTSSGVQQVIAGPNGQQHVMGAHYPILVQSQTPQAAQSPIQAPDKQMNMPPVSPALVPQSAPSPLSQANSPQLGQGNQGGQHPGSPVMATAPGQQMMMPNHHVLLSQSGQQKIMSPQSPQSAQKFPPPSPIQSMQTRSPTHTMISSQQQQGPQPPGNIVRTQQVFTPQVGQQGPPQQQQQQRINVQHVLVHPGGQQQGRFPLHQIMLQHQLQNQHQLLQHIQHDPNIQQPGSHSQNPGGIQGHNFIQLQGGMQLQRPSTQQGIPIHIQQQQQHGIPQQQSLRNLQMTQSHQGVPLHLHQGISVQESDLFWHFILSFRGGRQQQQQQVAWETPIRIPNDVVEKFKTTKRLERTEEHPERVKRMKMAEDEVLQISYLDDLPPPPMDGKEEEDIQPDIENRPPPVIMFSGFSDKFKTLATDKVKALGARITNDVTDATHLVIWEICTCKLYSALCRVKHIVSAGWVRDSYKAKRFVDETGYTPSITTFENFHKVPISDILKKPDRHILFKGMTFYLTPGLTGALRSGLEVIVEAAGGLVDRTNKSMADIKSTARENPRKYLIITNLDDFEYFSEFFDNKPNKTLSIFTAMFIYTCIVDQKVDLGVLPSKKSATKVEPANLG